MPSSPTPNAPTNYEELEKLLADDTKVKVAGQYPLSLNPGGGNEADMAVQVLMSMEY